MLSWIVLIKIEIESIIKIIEIIMEIEIEIEIIIKTIKIEKNIGIYK